MKKLKILTVFGVLLAMGITACNKGGDNGGGEDVQLLFLNLPLNLLMNPNIRMNTENGMKPKPQHVLQKAKNNANVLVVMSKQDLSMPKVTHGVNGQKKLPLHVQLMALKNVIVK